MAAACRASVVPDSIPSLDRIALTVNRATALLLLGQEAGWAVAGEIPAGVSAAMEKRLVAGGYLNMGYAGLLWGRYAEARQRLKVARRIVLQIGDARLLDDISVTVAHLDWLTGAWEGLADRVSTLADSDHGEPVNQLEVALVAGLLAAADGDTGTAEEQFGLVADGTRRRGVLDRLMEPTAALARLRLAQGHPDGAVEFTEEPVFTITRKGIWVWGTEIVPTRVEALVATARSEDAELLVEAFARGLRGRTAPGPKAALILCRAILAESRQRHSRAAALFGRAAEAWQNLPRPYDALLARERQARCLLKAGQAEAGLTVLSEALRGLTDLGARADADRVARELHGHGTARRGGRRGYGDQLSPREIEVVRLVMAGRTNREIADVLCRSPKTVATQVNSAMRKLKVSTRTALAVSAIETGILRTDQPSRPAYPSDHSVI